MVRPSQDLDQALLAAGRALLPERGCAGVSVRVLAEHAGVAPGMFHYRFGSKEQFLRTLLAGVYEEMLGSLVRETALEGPPVARLRAALALLARLWADASGALRTLPPLTAFSFLMGAVALPSIFVAGLVDAGLAPPGGKAAFEAQVMSDEAIYARIDLALAALAEPAGNAR
jgi:AcrR family transcriptional regulator